MEAKDVLVKNSEYDEASSETYESVGDSISDSVTTSSYHTVSIAIAEPSSPKHETHVKHTKNDLLNVKALSFLCLWYLFSAGTLFSNKYILSTLNSNPSVLGCSQILTTSICGYMQLNLCTSTGRRSATSNRHFIFNMLLLGTMRFMTVALGLVALKYVTVSFTETVKSSAPVFTVLVAWLVLSESTPLLVLLSLLPIMFGLALTSAYDLSFHIVGFLAALTNNVADCVQNVYSKYLFNSLDYAVHPVELQFYTSLTSFLLQVPVSLFLLDMSQIRADLNTWLSVYLLINGLFFHLQSFTAYSLMAHISPVTHSVCNTVKRALLIWLSILIFNDPITFLSGLGMLLVSFGVLLYNQARHYTENDKH
ncbi:solute carrier family 35 member E2A-like [Watersipora subatra]|uniref:solute carrier family 35 member E2A-like n=1 Tax=Watersipora subatra TaxID=2589382 RepID=UPI00355B69BD